MPWSPPRGCSLRFISDTQNDEEMILEFENHGKLMEAFLLLKSKYLEKSQFVHLNELHSGRGLHTTTVEDTVERVAVNKISPVTVESRRSRVKNLIDMFECLAFFPPSEKRSKQSEQPRELMQISKEERTKPPPLRSEGSEKIKKNQHDSISVEYRKREHTSPKLTSAMRTLDDYEVIKPTTSEEKTSGQVFEFIYFYCSFQKFANLGNTCYMNAMLQGLFAMDFFAKDLFKFCKKVQNRNVDLGEVIPMSSALSSLASIRDRASYHQKRELLRAIKDVSCFKGSAQQDANEFLVHVLNQVHDECDKLLHEQYGITDAGVRRMRNPVMANFAFTTQSTIVCDMCHHVSQIDEDSIILPVTINVLEQASERFSKKFLRFPSVQTLLDEYLKTENVERKCEVCGENIGQRTQKFVKLPRCLIIFIKRYAYDVSGSVKRDDKIDIPLYLTLNGHCTELSAPFLAVPTSTKHSVLSFSHYQLRLPFYDGKINFATANPIKLKLSTILSGTPSPARRRLDLSDKEINFDTRKVNDIEETHPAMTSLCNRPMDYKADGTNTAANHHMDFVVPGIGSNLKGGDQIAENFDVPRNSTEKKSQSSNSLTCEELSQLSDEEQLRTNDELEVPRGLAENSYSAHVRNSKQEPNSSDAEIFEEIRVEQERGNRQGVQLASRQEEGNNIEDSTEPNSEAQLGITDVTREMAIKETVVVFDADVNAERIKQDDEIEPGVLEESHMRSLAQSPIAGKVQEKQGKDEEIVIENFDMPCSMQREIKTSTPDVQKGSMIEHYQEKMSLESPSSVDGREILEESGMQLVPYKPMSAEKRRAICSQIGLRFNHDCIEKTTVRIMNPNDRPSRVADVVGDGNCLFRALAFYFAGSDIEHSRVRECIVEFEAEHWNEFAALKGWSSEIWNDHMNQLLTDNTWGTEIELFAVAAMLNVDVWTYYEKRWICYRPRFKIQNGDVIPISVGDYRLGDNDGVYLLNEFNHFTPVLEPSNALLLREGADERICDLIINANEGFLKPSYRLVSIISHLGDTSESGEYFEFILIISWPLCM
ncbi:unnamed protein product [Onchocerca ochengi]|uniref:Ubiquitinyl hydrolase 1 n=1 Tax=Onchocerca ochengi TaxID=42157 RepID=A0A182E357_ONCOC|nr:unnamed protein product [Onchocerca ochengi]